MQARTLRRALIVVAAFAAIATAAVGAVKLTPTMQWTPMVGVATGDIDHGSPVYRLPAVNVTASRSAELAKMAQEDAVAMK
jgi:hypothetical protein